MPLLKVQPYYFVLDCPSFINESRYIIKANPLHSLHISQPLPSSLHHVECVRFIISLFMRPVQMNESDQRTTPRRTFILTTPFIYYPFSWQNALWQSVMEWNGCRFFHSKMHKYYLFANFPFTLSVPHPFSLYLFPSETEIVGLRLEPFPQSKTCLSVEVSVMEMDQRRLFSDSFFV